MSYEAKAELDALIAMYEDKVIDAREFIWQTVGIAMQMPLEAKAAPAKPERLPRKVHRVINERRKRHGH